MVSIVSVGEATIDHYLDLNQDFVGGISLNFAVHAKRCGAEYVSLISCVGNDQHEHILAKLNVEGIDGSHVCVQSGETARQNILLTDTGDRIFPAGGYQSGVLQNFHLNETDLQFIHSHNVLVSALFQQTESLFHQTMQMDTYNGWRVADFLDLSDYGKDVSAIEPFTNRLTIAFLSGDQESIERLRPLSRATSCLIVVTLGTQGSAALIKGEPVVQPCVSAAKVLDTTGCGDAFQAAFTVSYWRNGDVREALRSGAEQAARVLQHYGAIGP